MICDVRSEVRRSNISDFTSNFLPPHSTFPHLLQHFVFRQSVFTGTSMQTPMLGSRWSLTVVSIGDADLKIGDPGGASRDQFPGRISGNNNLFAVLRDVVPGFH